ncbi:MAG: hypothetical protein HFE84_03675 [Lachnospiraceae bacterium]|nr:hypothetical protein [Lachnospiraceae bacterium]
MHLWGVVPSFYGKAKRYIRPEWYESDDPKRLVPLFGPEANIVVIVVGDPPRNRSQFFRSNYTMAKLTSKAIKLPEHWMA